MTDYAIHSPNDGELLIRLHDELVRHGMKSFSMWNKEHNPSEESKENKEAAKEEGREVWHYTLAVYADKYIFYHNHECESLKNQRTITKRNFQTVLNEVLQNFGIEYRNP